MDKDSLSILQSFKTQHKLKNLVPERFNFPFYHTPPPLAMVAASKLKELLGENAICHDFNASGKMFGVLVVRKNETLYYLQAYSGKLTEDERPEGFVPPVYDVHKMEGLFKNMEPRIEALSEKITSVENSRRYKNAADRYQTKKKEYERFVLEGKASLRMAKQRRSKIRSSRISTTEKEALDNESRSDNTAFRRAKKALALDVQKALVVLEKFNKQIATIKAERAELSGHVQKSLFKKYYFLNAHKEKKSLFELFQNSFAKTPPSGAGECCAPRLLQFAFANDLEPVCFTEFWWGASPPLEIRTHGFHYPACRGKCEPILGHMLSKNEVEMNPLDVPAECEKIEILYEDIHLLAVNKPSGVLSVPGKKISASVLSIVAKQLGVEELFNVHRLDRQTSGILLIAKSNKISSLLQKEFESRRVQKTYEALLTYLPSTTKKGLISLPLKADLLDLPRQLVCPKEGKSAETSYEIIETKKPHPRVLFFPKTGRSHQIRIHAAHDNGLGVPILGDDLYGMGGDRLFLHAKELLFTHPITGKKTTILCQTPF